MKTTFHSFANGISCLLIGIVFSSLISQTSPGQQAAAEGGDQATLQTTVVESSEPRPGPRTHPPAPATAAPPAPVVNQVVITPTKTPKLIADVPVAISSINPEEMARIAPLSFDDLVQSVPNVSFLGGPRFLGEQLVVRGEGGNAVTVRIDDARQNFVSGHTGQRFFLETDFLKQAEILRGGGSFLYGSGSAGVFNLSTLDPEDIIREDRALGLRQRDTYHSNNNEWAHSLIGAAGGNGVQVLVGGSMRDGQNITQSGGVELPFSNAERDGAIGKIVFTPNDETRIEFGINDYQSRDLGGANPQALSVGTTTNALVNRIVNFTQLVGDLEWNPADNDLLDIKASVYHNTTSQNRNYVGGGTNANRRNVHQLDVYGIDANNRSVIDFNGTEHELVYGIDYFREKQNGSETRATFFVPGSPGNASGRPDAEADHLGLFLTDEIDLTDSLTVFTGIRYDTYESIKTAGAASQQSDGAFLPQIGFDFDVTENLSFFGQVSRGFNAPTLNDLYQEGSHFGVVPLTFPLGNTWMEEVFIANANLKPEESTNFELGIHFEDEDFRGGKFSSRANGFYKSGQNTFDTEIVGSQVVANRPFPGQLTTQLFRQAVNRAETEIYGFEFSSDYDADTWFTGLDLGVVRGQDITTGQELNTITGNQLAVTLGARPLENLEVGVRGLWNGGREHLVSDATLKTPAYDLYGVFGSWKVNESWTLRGGVDNLFDQGHERTSLFLEEPGRNAFISSTIEW